MTLLSTAQEGDRLATLEASRDVVAQAIEGRHCPECGEISRRDLAALVARLQSILEEIETLKPTKRAQTPLDELESRRAGRSNAKVL